MKKSLPWLLTFVVVLGVGACSDGSDATEGAASDADTTGRGVVAPMFDGQLLSGGELSLDSLRGRPIVVNFWTTTCVPCVREMPALAGAAREHEAEGLVVIGVNYGESQERVQSFVDEFEVAIEYPIVLDLDGSVGRSYGVAALPMTYFVDSDGVVQYRRIGELEERHLDEGLSRIK